MSARQQLKDLEVLIKTIKSSTPAELNESASEKNARITRLLNNWPEFLKYYFPNLAKSEFAPFHLRGGDAVLSSESKKMMFAWMASRALSKTTFWQMFAIYLNCRAIKGMSHGYKTCIWWSKTFDSPNGGAVDSMRLIRLQFEYNEKLISDFGLFKSLSTWSDDKLITAQGITWKALGKGQSPRGSKDEEAVRPDLIIGDDFDDDEEVLNEHRLDKSYNWIMGALWGTMDISSKALFVVLNNRIAEDSLMTRLYEIADYKETVNLVDEDGNPTWSARHSKEDCHYMMQKMGTILAEREYQNNPTTQGDVFRKEWMVDKKMDSLADYVVLIAYLDPSFKNKKNADHKSWLLLGLTRAGEIHVLKPFCARASVDEMIGWGYEIQTYVHRRNQVCQLWMEEVFLQDLLYKDFAEYAKKNRLPPLPVQGDTRPKPDKDQRIMATQGYFERSNVYFNEAEKDNHHMKALKLQFTSFKMGHTGIKKDGPDAFEGGLYKLLQMWGANHPAESGRRSRNKNMY